MAMAAQTIPGKQLEDVPENQPATVSEDAGEDRPDGAAKSHTPTKSDENAPSVEFAQLEPGPARLNVAPRAGGNTVRDNVNEYLLAIDGQVLGVQAATASYRGRPLDWVDVTTLRQVREHLGQALEGINSAKAAAELKRAARQVATDLRRHRETQ